MRNAVSYLLVTFFVAQTALYGEDNPQPSSQEILNSNANLQDPVNSQQPFSAFTGRTTRNKVRVRLQPTLDAPILKEINKGDLFVVVGETNDFYALEAPADIKGYVFRTFVLDNIVEGNRVNVRLEPHLESPVIAQLNVGDKVDGQISAINSKWLEITPPNSTRFYIAREYVEKIGDSGLKASLDQKRETGARILSNAFAMSQNELRKPWNQIKLDEITDNLNKIIKDYSDFPEIQSKAKELLTMIQETYFRKKVEYLESLAKNTDQIKAQNKELSNKVSVQEQRINELEQTRFPTPTNSSSMPPPPTYNNLPANPVDKMNTWLPVENQFYENWAEIHQRQPISSFYDEQMQNAAKLSGIIQVYDRSVRNKPGDYVLLNPATRIPIAYLYSTLVNLEGLIGKNVTLKVSPRDNRNFAYPAFFVLSVE